MARSERSGHTTTDHDFIRRWVEERGGWPARVVGTGGGNDAGLIRIDFPGFSGEGSLERIEWDEWFQGFEANQLAFLHRDMSHGGGDLDRFNKLVSRTGDEDGEGGDGGSSARSRGGSGSARKAGGAEGKASSGRGTTARKAEAAGAGAGRRGGTSATADTGDKGNGRASSGRGGSARKAESRDSGNGRRGGASTAAETGARSTGARGAKGGGRAGGADGPGNNELRALLLHQLGDLLSAERLFLGSTRTLAREAQDPEVRSRAEEHVGETEGQIERLKEAFGAVGERPRAVTCEAALGLKEEHDSFKSEEKPSKQLLSAYGLGSGLRVEHYEIAAYRSAIELATALGERECARILNESLKEELAMASFLEKNSRAVLKRMISGAAGGTEGGGAGKASSRGGSSSAKKPSGSGSSSGKKSGGSGGGRARGGARA